ncbi:MAG: hypothetical protein KDN22_26310 [Verrucomicrobiae bacterium]|nr:hypothetical protein [Verrucomicrobiae bacterium]
MMNDAAKCFVACVALGAAGVAVGYGLACLATLGEHPESDSHSDAPVAVVSSPPLEELPDFLSMNEGELAASLMSLAPSQLRRAVRFFSAGDVTDSRRQLALRTALEVMAERDPEKFLRWIDTADVPLGLATSAIEIAGARLVKGDPDESMTFLRSIGSTKIRRSAVVAFASALSEREPQSAIQLLISAGMNEEIETVASAIAVRDPVAAANIFADIRDASIITAQLGMKPMIAQWARQDPEAAWAWLNATDNHSTSRLGKINLINELAANPASAKLALAYLREWPNDPVRQTLAREVAGKLAEHPDLDPAVLTSMLDTADPAERGAMLAGIIGALPPDGMVAAIESLPGQTQRKEAIGKAMTTAPDRQTALQIAQSLSKPPDRITARHQLLRSYRMNQQEAVQVAMAAEFPRERDNLMERVAGWLLPSDTMRADDPAWITSLPPEQRHELESALTRVASQKAIPIPKNVGSALSGE